MVTGMVDSVKALLDCVRSEVRSLPQYNAGLSSEYVRAYYSVERVAKLGSNENPYGPSWKVREAFVNAVEEIGLYPEPACDSLRAVMAERLQVSQQQLIFGNGSEDLIAVAAHTFLSPASRVVTFAPSFGLHVICPQSVGAEVCTVHVRGDYRVDIDELLTALTPETRMLIFGNPSNPVGTSLTANELEAVIARLSPETLLVFDEAYLEYASADPNYPDFLALLKKVEHPWLMLRTFSKAYGLAGLRIGYAIASAPELIKLMDRVRAPFNVNRFAQIAAIAAVGDTTYVQDVVEKTVAERERMRQLIQSGGYRVAPSLTNFLFVQSREDASELAGRLLTRGLIVKPWREPGYIDHVRISVGLPEQNDMLLDAWTALAR